MKLEIDFNDAIELLHVHYKPQIDSCEDNMTSQPTRLLSLFEFNDS